MKILQRTISLFTGGLLCLPSTVALPLLATAAVFTSTREAEALPVDRMYGRQSARFSRQAGRRGAQYSRQTGRQVSRARRRGYYALPVGYRPVTYGRYNYYFAGGRYYYPYMYGGRTVYVTVNVDASGNPGPPPPPGLIDIDIY